MISSACVERHGGGVKSALTIQEQALECRLFIAPSLLPKRRKEIVHEKISQGLRWGRSHHCGDRPAGTRDDGDLPSLNRDLSQFLQMFDRM